MNTKVCYFFSRISYKKIKCELSPPGHGLLIESTWAGLKISADLTHFVEF